MNIKLDKSFFINDVTMFIIGSMIGTILHFSIEYIIDKYKVETTRDLTIIGVLQLCVIAYIAKFLTNLTGLVGFLTLGLFTSQRIVLYSLFPKNTYEKDTIITLIQ